MAGFTEHFKRLQRSPGMFVPEVSYDSVVSYIVGFDAACYGGVLSGFREWLVSNWSVSTSQHWSESALPVIFPVGGHPRDNLCDPASHEYAIQKLLELFFAFAERRDKVGLRVIFLDYERWLRKQPWYEPGSPEWYEWDTFNQGV